MSKGKRCMALVTLVAMILMITVALSGCSYESEIKIPTPEENVFIYDMDEIIEDGVENKLNTMLVQLEEKTSVEFVVISIESLNNINIESYSNKVFNTLGIGKDDKDNGIMLLFSRNDVKVRLEIGRGLEGILNDSKCGRILDDYFVPYRSEDKYSEATNYTVNAVLTVLSEEYDFSIEGLEAVTVSEDEWTTFDTLILIL